MSGGVRGLPHDAIGALVLVVAAVAQVEPRDIHAGVHELVDALR
jgi:hypothetical protein